ncbi:MAG: patatin-like phospholipase family protein [Fusobacteriaceae bacterium]|jgi:NTE family protein|nr:patatin-like phospholipase family protein [Fusobacteriaceae bacterium]
MRKALIFFVLSFLFPFSIYCENVPLTKEERLKAIDGEIEKLLEKKKELEALKKTILSEKSDFIQKKPKANVSPGKPKIALVLSGGGAKGAAHIGVLQVLEKYNVPLDLIVGTSIGSFVGAMYATGYSPQEIESILLRSNFTSPFTTDTRKRPFTDAYEKLTFEKYPLNFRVTDKFQLSLPRGFVSNQQTYFDLKNIFSRAENIEDYDELPIRFRAVATDLQTSSPAVSEKGDLALNVLKSMSFPSVFPPVEDKGHFYVDGGITNNFPVDLAIRMGADIVIAVDVSTAPIVIDDDSNMFNVVEQLSSYHGDMNTVFLKKLPTILIVPDVQGHKTMDFTDMEPLVAKGYESAMKYGEILKSLGDPARFASIKEKRLTEKDKEIDRVVLEGNRALTLKNVQKLRPGKDDILSREDLDKWAKQIYSIPYIDRVLYQLEGTTLTFHVLEQHDIRVRAALGYASRYGAGMKVLVNFPQYGVWNRNYSISGELSTYPKVSLGNSSYYDSMRVKFGTTFTLGYEQNPFFIRRAGENTSTYRSEKFAGTMDLFTSLFKQVVLGATMTAEYGKITYDSGERTPGAFENKTRRLLTGAYLAVDTLNNRIFPEKGVFLYGEAIHSADDYMRYKIQSDLYFQLTKDFSFNLGASYGKITGSHVRTEDLFRIGGGRNVNVKDHITFFGLPIMGRYADEYYTVGAGVQYKLRNSLYLLGKYNVLAYHSDGFLYQENRNLRDDLTKGYGVGIGWDTFVGPVTLFLTNDVDRKNKLMFEMRFGFLF